MTWSSHNGRFKPDYTQRLNRQYMPPRWLETGAFMISKASVLTPESRIGHNVGVFEVPDRESGDIDTFADLIAADGLLSTHRTAIYVNGNSTRGTGHIYRALEIADELYTKPDICYDVNQTRPEIFGRTAHELVPVNGIAELFDRCRRENYSMFINDIFATSVDYMIALRTVLPYAKIINFEDTGEGASKADIVFNALYEEGSTPNVYAGSDYYIPGKLFMFYEPVKIAGQVKNVFISFGGAAPQSYTDRILAMISGPEYQAYHFTVVLGREKSNVETLMQYNQHANITVLHDVDDMPGVMSGCDVGITSQERTGYELAVLGVPSIAMAQNKGEEEHTFISDINGFKYLGLNTGKLWEYLLLRRLCFILTGHMMRE